MATAPTGSATLSIGALSDRTGRSIHTLRWYEAQGLMPGVVRDAGGRRVYGARHVDWVDLLARLQRTGMSIAQMREYADLVRRGRATLRQRHRLLADHRTKVVATILDWNESLALLEHKIDLYDAWIETGRRLVTAPKVVEPRRPKKRP